MYAFIDEQLAAYGVEPISENRLGKEPVLAL
jgi:hypothetical protein